MIRALMSAQAQEHASYAQVERVLNSRTFCNAEVLRRLLRFIAGKSIAGQAEQLKEYTIAVDGLGKPASYDPHQDSLVRIEIGRLRSRLAEYYRTEGENDPVVLAIPKGQFKLTWTARQVPQPVQHSSLGAASPISSIAPATTRRSNTRTIVASVLAAWALTATILLWQEHRSISPLRQAWTLELQELWRPFLESKRPLIVAVSAPLFVGFQGSGFYRDQNLNEWDEVLTSRKIQALRKALNNPTILPRYYYTGLGELSASFQLGKLLGDSGLDMSTTWSSILSWQQIVDDNILLVGPARVFRDQLRKLPVHPELALSEDGIHDLQGKPSQPALFADNYPSINGDQSAISDDGIVYALVSRMPGPLGSGCIETFSSNHSPGTEGAVEFFTKPNLAGQLVAKLRESNGHVPRFFQVVIKVAYRDAIPVEISYVTHRELQPRSTANSVSEPYSR
jgi:hypothetical protein